LYSRDAVLLPTLSDEPRTDHDSIVDYASLSRRKRPGVRCPVSCCCS
jgi:hypothetical protein